MATASSQHKRLTNALCHSVSFGVHTGRSRHPRCDVSGTSHRDVFLTLTLGAGALLERTWYATELLWKFRLVHGAEGCLYLRLF